MIINLDKQPIIKDEDCVSIYANSASVIASLYDIALTFGVQSIASSGDITISEKCKIYVSPQHAKVLLGIIQQNLDSYESKFGVIHTNEIFTSEKV